MTAPAPAKRVEEMARTALVYVMALAWLACTVASVSKGGGITGCCERFGDALTGTARASTEDTSE